VKRTLVAVGLLFVSLHAAPAATNSPLHAVLSTNTLHVGDRLELIITATHDANERWVIPSIRRDPFIVVWDSQSSQQNTSDGRKVTTTRIAFSSFVIGEHRVSTNPVIRMNADGTEEAIEFPLLVFNVVSVLTNPPPALAEIKPPVSLPGQQWLRILWILLAVVVLAILAASLIRWWLKRPCTAIPTQSIPPHEIALAALNALRQRGLIEKGDAEPFYIELSDIVRLYLEQRFDLHAPEQTTEEFIRSSSQSSQLSSDHRVLTQSFLEQSDLVKFARFEPSPTDMQSAWDAADRLVRETIPAPASTTGGGA